MACACKAKKTGQVTAVKQVVKTSSTQSSKPVIRKKVMKVVRRPFY